MNEVIFIKRAKLISANFQTTLLYEAFFRTHFRHFSSFMNHDIGKVIKVIHQILGFDE